MNKICLLLLLMVHLVACKQTTDDVTITGEIKGLGNDTLYLYGIDTWYDRVDTLYSENDKFSFTMQVDTITSALLLIKNKVEYPLFIDKNNQITIKGDTAQLNALTVKGNPYNEEFTTFQKGIGQNPLEAERKAEEFITNHPASYVSLYLLDKYFVQSEQLNFEKIKKLTEGMAGVLKDKSYIEHLNDAIVQVEKTNVGKYAPYFTLLNTQGKRLTRTSEEFRQKYLLMTIWASWGDSIAYQKNLQVLKDIHKEYKKNRHVNLLGVSLDIDKEKWMQQVKKDSVKWEQVCEPDGLNSNMGKQYLNQQLPQNIIISIDGRIVSKDLEGEALKTKIKELVKEAEEKDQKEKRKRK